MFTEGEGFGRRPLQEDRAVAWAGVRRVLVRGRLAVKSSSWRFAVAAQGLGIARPPRALVIEALAANQLVEVLDAYTPPA